MKRRSFINSLLATGTLANSSSVNLNAAVLKNSSSNTIPKKIAGYTIHELKNEYHRYLFDRYFPFWEKEGIDRKYGGIICFLNEDGTISDDEKALWYQGRAVWTYSKVYNDFGKDPHFLDIAQNIRDFMVKYMYAGNGTWNQRTQRDGAVKGGITDDLIGEYYYGWLYAAEGLVELYRATGNVEDLKLARESIKAALKVYNDPSYNGAWNYGGYSSDLSFKGFRVQGHSMVLAGVLTQLLNQIKDDELENLQREHINYIMNVFYNSELGVTNENLRHDYSRIPGYEDYMFPGHSVETLWFVMFEALRIKDRVLFNTAVKRILNYIEIGWDYVFEGFGDLHYWVYDGDDRTREKMYGVKSMWSHAELMIATMHILEYTGDIRANEWYERVRDYSYRVFDTDYGVWRQAVDRSGKDKKRKEVYNPTRKDNYHYSRYLILNLLSLERIIKNGGKTTPFPL